MSFLISLEKYILAISPFLLLGLTIAGFIHIFLDVDKVKSLINTGKKENTGTGTISLYYSHTQQQRNTKEDDDGRVEEDPLFFVLTKHSNCQNGLFRAAEYVI